MSITGSSLADRYGTSRSSTSNGKNTTEKQAIQNISQCLFNAEIQMHITHLQAVHKSFEIHNALGAFYDALGDLNDELVEKSYAKVGIMDKYKDMPMQNNLEPIPYIKAMMKEIETNRENITSGYIQQLTDNIIETVAHVIYKLENLT